MTSKEITEKLESRGKKFTRRYIEYILSGERRPSPELAADLEEITGVDRRKWLYPAEFGNPLMPNVHLVANS